jgi:sensor histidine kinase YesM
MNYLKEIGKALLISIIIFFVIVVINYILGNPQLNYEWLKLQFIYILVYTVTIYFANAFVFIQLDKIFEKNRFHIKRLLIGFLASFFVSIFIIFCLRMLEQVGIENKTIVAFLQYEKPANYIVALVITLIVSLFIHLVYFYKSFQENKVKEQKIIANVASAQFESLKNQIDPHFLFNSLNVLSSLIEENPENAQKFTTSLSKVYRYVLEQKNKELVSVAEELQFAKTYMNLLKMRFENSITFEIPEHSENEDAKVVPLSLQLILENSIKHNVVSATKPLHIKIYVANNELIITNNLQKKEVLQDRKGVGLQNIVNRYAILTNRKVKIQESNDLFSVQLPILTKQISTMENTTTYNEQQAYERALKRVKDIKEFYGNLISYAIVIPVLIIINLKTYSKFQWFWFPMFGWGLGLLFHGLGVFGYGKSWEERKIQEILDKEKHTQNKWQ